MLAEAVLEASTSGEIFEVFAIAGKRLEESGEVMSEYVKACNAFIDDPMNKATQERVGHLDMEYVATRATIPPCRRRGSSRPPT